MKFLWKFYLADRKIILSQKFLGTSFFHSENLVLNITMHKKSISTFFKRITYFIPTEMILLLKIQKIQVY